MGRHFASNSLTLFVVILFLLGALIKTLQAKYLSPSLLQEAICLEDASGSSISSIAEKLQLEGIVSSKTLFQLGIDYSGRGSDLKAGSYLVPAGSSMSQIADQITTSGRNTCGTEVIFRVGVTRNTVLVRELDPATNRYVEVSRGDLNEDSESDFYLSALKDDDSRIRIAVSEGTTSWSIVNALKGFNILDGPIIDMPAEGTLAPDSYEISIGDLRANVLTRMMKVQDRRLKKVWGMRSDKTPVDNMQDLLVLASIIEKETAVASERPQVASVFANRLKLGMPLQTDPSVIYGITLGKSSLGRGLRKSELRKDTPWNTYVNRGLPQSAIASPGLASLKAAINPANTNYIFFVADGSGGHAFSTNLKEHNRNVAAWRKIEKTK
jgi:UPF0755 protein